MSVTALTKALMWLAATSPRQPDLEAAPLEQLVRAELEPALAALRASWQNTPMQWVDALGVALASAGQRIR